MHEDALKDWLMKRLSHCPFCGCKKIFLCVSFDNYAWCTECNAKSASFKLTGYTSKNNYLARLLVKVCNSWNRRYEE